MKKSKKQRNQFTSAFRMQRRYQVLQDKCLEQEKRVYDLTQLIEISKSLNSLLSLDRILESIMYTLMAQMKSPYCLIFIQKSFDVEKLELSSKYLDITDDEGNLLSIDKDHPILKILNELEEAITVDELQKILPKNEILQKLTQFEPELFVPLKTKSQIVGFLVLSAPMDVHHFYTEYEKSLVMDISKLAASAIHNSLLVEMATTDIMTRLKLKHYFFTVISERLATMPSKISISVMMLDVDHFKVVNDTYGHACGDVVLQKIAKLIENSIRSEDLAARYGGEEFVVFLDNTDQDLGIAIAERIRKAVEAMIIEYEETKLSVTISIGVAEYAGKPETLKQLVDRADKALYVSKNSGRNKVSFL